MFRRAVTSLHSRLPRQSAVLARRALSSYRAVRGRNVAVASLLLAGAAGAVATSRAEAAAPAVDYKAVREVS